MVIPRDLGPARPPRRAARKPSAEQSLAGETLRTPDVASPVVLAHRARAGGDHHPGLFRLRVDVNVGTQAIRIIERPYAHEAQCVPRADVGTPQGHTADRAAGDLLALAAVARRHHELGASLKQHHPIGLNDSVERKGGAALALAPAAMTAMHDERRAGERKANGAAGASAFGGGWPGITHA